MRALWYTLVVACVTIPLVFHHIRLEERCNEIHEPLVLFPQRVCQERKELLSKVRYKAKRSRNLNTNERRVRGSYFNINKQMSRFKGTA